LKTAVPGRVPGVQIPPPPPMTLSIRKGSASGLPIHHDPVNRGPSAVGTALTWTLRQCRAEEVPWSSLLKLRTQNVPLPLYRSPRVVSPSPNVEEECSMLTRKASFLGLTSVFLAGFAPGGEAIPNWPAPATQEGMATGLTPWFSDSAQPQRVRRRSSPRGASLFLFCSWSW
jgi:hypothetical protein